jgi:hypothetical protein
LLNLAHNVALLAIGNDAALALLDEMVSEFEALLPHHIGWAITQS